MIRLPNITVVILKLRLTDSLSIDTNKKYKPTICVNGETIYHVQGYSEGYSPFLVKRSVFGVALLIPSSYPQYHVFRDGEYYDQFRGVA
jgi:hypothetical protein